VPVVIGKGARSVASVCHSLNITVSKIAVTRSALFRRRLRRQTTVAIIIKASGLSGLIAARDLIACVVSVRGGGIEALIPIQFIDLFQASEDVHYQLAASAALISNRRDLASCTPAASVSIFSCGSPWESCYPGPPRPVVCLRSPNPTSRILTRRHPATGHFRGIRLRREPAHFVVGPKLAAVASSSIGIITADRA
jgi:hypothetical protein